MAPSIYFQIQSGSAVELVLNGFGTAPERVVFSPLGTAAALYHPGSIEILNGLAHSPIVTAGFELTTAGVPESMALSSPPVDRLSFSPREPISACWHCRPGCGDIRTGHA